MTQLEFDAAWNNSPPVDVVEILQRGDCVIRVQRPMDARWHYRGTAPSGPLDLMIPCDCQLDVKDWKWSGPPEPIPEVKGHAVDVCCQGARFPGTTWYFIGQCPECRCVYWFHR